MLTKIKEEIKSIENKASLLGTTEPLDKSKLYDLLVIAYNKNKDIISLLEEKQPTLEIEKLNFKIVMLEKELKKEKNNNEYLIKKLEHITLLISQKAGDNSEDHY